MLRADLDDRADDESTGLTRRALPTLVMAVLVVACAQAAAIEWEDWGVAFSAIPAVCGFSGFQGDTSYGEGALRFDCEGGGTIWFYRAPLNAIAGQVPERPALTDELTVRWLAPSGEIAWIVEGHLVDVDLVRQFAEGVEPIEP